MYLHFKNQKGTNQQLHETMLSTSIDGMKDEQRIMIS